MDGEINNSFEGFASELDLDLIQLLQERGIKSLFPVQNEVIPILLDSIRKPNEFPPRDICVSAPTGSGKTLCYVLPIIQSLKRRRQRRIRALVVVPVVNLAKQVYDVFNIYTSGTNLKTVLITGKQSFQKEVELLYESNGNDKVFASCDIVVATPGRLLDHIRSNPKGFILKFLRFLVLDEADRLMNDFRLDWIKEVEEAIFVNRPWDEIERFPIGLGSISQLIAAGRFPLQKILLSATLSHNPEQLKQLNLFQANYLNVISSGKLEVFETKGNIGVPEELEEFYVKCELNWKPLIVFRLIEKFAYKKVLCFVSKRESSQRLAHVLQYLGIKNVKEATAKGNKFRMERMLKQFAKGNVSVVICTDLMARGMDFDKIDCVINYDVPEFVRTYVHRIGRTARAGAKGVAVTLTDPSELLKFQKILDEVDHFKKLNEVEMGSEELDKYKEEYRLALTKLRDETEKQNAIHNTKNRQNTFGKRIKTETPDNVGNKPKRRQINTIKQIKHEESDVE